MPRPSPTKTARESLSIFHLTRSLHYKACFELPFSLSSSSSTLFFLFLWLFLWLLWWWWWWWGTVVVSKFTDPRSSVPTRGAVPASFLDRTFPFKLFNIHIDVDSGHVHTVISHLSRNLFLDEDGDLCCRHPLERRTVDNEGEFRTIDWWLNFYVEGTDASTWYRRNTFFHLLTYLQWQT